MINKLIEARKDILYHYSPVSFLNKEFNEKIFKYTVKNEILTENNNNKTVQHFVEVDNKIFIFIINYLEWDSNYFNVPTFKLKTILYNPTDYSFLGKAINQFISKYLKKKDYCFIEIPSEDIWTIQSLNLNKFKLVETRLTYYLDLKNFENERFLVRKATISDAENLKHIASQMVNIYDRFHADLSYNTKKADEFLSTYIEESLKGLADCVIVPDESVAPPDAFVTAKYMKKEWEEIDKKVSKMVLSAVSSETCRGWYIKLISEMAYHLKNIGADWAYMHPATTNKAVIYSYEKLGCKYGKCVHILSYIK
jgi:dTDP-4-amino-4,6-dideoxy-D-galactose acyltransferase